MTKPQTFLVGQTQVNFEGVRDLLEALDAMDFYDEFADGESDHGPICLASLYAKLCYRSLVEGKNANITKVRGIEGNIQGTFEHKHGAVFEHVTLNFVTINCSRVFTHELVRHRVGTAFSQTSGRYCTPEDAEMILPPELDIDIAMPDGIVNPALEMRMHLEGTKSLIEKLRAALKVDDLPMYMRKKFTSALRRIMPSGANNEMGWSVNVRALRHLIELRTSRHAEWEIRYVFNEVAKIVNEKWPLMLYGGTVEMVDDLVEYTNLRV